MSPPSLRPPRARTSLVSPALLLVVVLVVAACESGGAGSTSTTSSTVPPTTAEATTTTVEPTTTVPVGVDDLPAAIREQVIELVGVTQEIRELAFSEPPTVTVVSAEELVERVQAEIEENAEDVPADQALYVLLGLLEPGTDLLQLYLDLYGEQVGGYYDSEEGELVIPAGGDSLTVLERATLVHELTHALADQEFGYGERRERLIDEERFDEDLAFLSVLEGDALLTEILYVQRLDPEERQEFLAESLAAESEVISQAPQFIQDALVFPYLRGLEFVSRLHDIGGFAEVGKAYLDPPVSTEQVITPRDHGRDEPVPVEIGALEVPGYELVYQSVWGELGFALMFDQVLGGRPEAADGWGGDSYQVWFDGSDVVLALVYRGDAESDAAELEAALLEYVSAVMAVSDPAPADGLTAMTGDDYAAVGRSGDSVTFVASSDPAVGPAVAAALVG